MRMKRPWPNQSAAAPPAGQSDGSGNLAAIIAADRAFPAAVAELGQAVGGARTTDIFGGNHLNCGGCVHETFGLLRDAGDFQVQEFLEREILQRFDLVRQGRVGLGHQGGRKREADRECGKVCDAAQSGTWESGGRRAPLATYEKLGA